MKLYFTGHAERYAVEQSLLMLFPDERPLYPDAPPSADEAALHLRLSEGRTLSATANLSYAGQTTRRVCRCAIPEAADEIVLTRLRRRTLQRAFYLAAVEILGSEPPWGMLSGVRPVKLPVRAVNRGLTLFAAERELRTQYRVSDARCALAMDCARATLSVQAQLLPNEISLYLGIPFCPTRCTYCSFVSAAGGAQRLIPPYLQALHAEIEAAGQAVRAAGLCVRSVYVGGGTPTTLEAADLSALLQALRQAFPLRDGAEITVEAGRPDTITREKLLALREGGATRVSLNPQSLSDAVLRAIGRAHTVADFFSAWDLVKEVGFSCVNTDLIAGLPADDPDGFARSLDGVLALAPENITVHTLAQKRGATLREQTSTLPDEAATAAMLTYAHTRLRAAGYLPYYLYRQKFSTGGFENIGWCKKGFESEYNICMMEELHSVLSLGAGGITKRVRYAEGSLTRLSNPKYPQEYIRDCAQICLGKQTIPW